MPKSKDRMTHAAEQERTEQALDVLESAVTAEPDLDTPAYSSALDEALDSLPERLRDPFAVLERGRALLHMGLPVRDTEQVETHFEDELRIAARNGKPIPDDIRDLMSEERAHTEHPKRPEPPAVNPLVPASKSVTIQRMHVPISAASVSLRREVEIEELAALLVAESYCDGAVDLERIASAQEVSFSFGHYRDCFDGLLECRNSAFHIYINIDANRGSRSPRARFSFAHELGHYFLDWHRLALDRGVPPHGSKADFESGDLAEREADMFAAYLLLPAMCVKKAAHHRIDATEIVRLAQLFCTSLSATAIRCAHLDLAPLIVMRWTATARAWCWSSSMFEQRTGNKAFRSIERLPLDSATRETLRGKVRENETITRRGTTLSTWFPGVRAGSSLDDILIEECISLGIHGALTILRPS
jgi:Zn-dependent peptidase ImmA (M78 family)